MHDGHEPEIREACRDGVRVRNQDVSLIKKRVRCSRGNLTERLTPLKSPWMILAL